MTTKQELRDQRDRARVVVAELVAERNAALDELAAVRSERDDALDRLAARDAVTPAPRAFRVGDRVRVAEGATSRTASGLPRPSRAVGLFGQVTRIACDGDLWVHVGSGSGDWASPEFCTLTEDSPEPEPTPERVTLTLADGTRIEFNAVVTR